MRLVAVDDQLMRPERCHVPASPEALSSLTPTCPPDRVREAAALMLAPDDGNECTFELLDDRWAPLTEMIPSQRPLTRGEMVSLIGDLQTQLTLMRGLHDALLGRLVSVEAAMQAKSAADPQGTPRAGRKVPSRRDMLAVLQRPAPEGAGPLALDGPRELAEAPPKHGPVPTESAPNAEVADAPAAVAAPRVRPTMAPVAPRLALPEQGDVIQCLRMLAADVELAPGTATLPGDLADFYVARLVDASQEPLGAILINQRASAALGGGLLGLPLAVRDEQARRGIAKDTLEGLNEICNNLNGLINRKNPKGYAKLCAIERVSDAALPWLTQAASALGLTTPSNGALWLASR
jgi:hypothetical protein